MSEKPAETPGPDQTSEKSTQPRRLSLANRILNYTFGDKITLAAVIALVVIAWKVIDWRINEIVGSDAYIRRVAEEVRPSVIFNGKGNILVDQGGMRYLDSIRILSYHPDRPEIPFRILVCPKQHLAYAPVLIPFDQTVAGSQVERTNAIDWVYSVTYGAILEENATPQFRLEILR
jgi:hypothetical protein